MLRIVLQQSNPESFQDALSEFLHRLSSLSPEFYEYFNRDWVGKEESWAYCHRKGMGINTNMMVEAFHRVFKYGYLKGKSNRRVDNCLVNLMKFARDKLFDRVIKVTKGKNTLRVKMIQNRHTKSVQMSVSDVESKSESTWLVKSENGTNTYVVSKHVSTCTDNNNCQLKCTDCSTRVCIHQYTCTCPDSLIQSTICKHIHLLQRYLSQDQSIAMDGPGDDSEFSHSEVELASSFLRQTEKEANDSSALKNSIKEKLLRLGKQIELCTNIEALQQLDKNINAAQHLFSSLQKQVTQHKLQPIWNTPANKNIEKQKRFNSTMKKVKNTSASRSRFAKPTLEESQSLLSPTCDGMYIFQLSPTTYMHNKR